MSFSDLSSQAQQSINAILQRRTCDVTYFKPFNYWSNETGFIEVKRVQQSDGKIAIVIGRV